MIGTLWPFTLETSPAAIGSDISRRVRHEDDAAWARFEAAHPELVEVVPASNPTAAALAVAVQSIQQRRGAFR